MLIYRHLVIVNLLCVYESQLFIRPTYFKELPKGELYDREGYLSHNCRRVSSVEAR